MSQLDLKSKNCARNLQDIHSVLSLLAPLIKNSQNYEESKPKIIKDLKRVLAEYNDSFIQLFIAQLYHSGVISEEEYVFLFAGNVL